MIWKLVQKQKWGKILCQLIQILTRRKKKKNKIKLPIFYYSCIPVNPNLVNSLAKIFRNVGTTLMSSSSNKLKDLLSNPLDEVEEGGKSGIYKM